MARSKGKPASGKHKGNKSSKSAPAMKHAAPHGKGRTGTGKKPKNYNAAGKHSTLYGSKKKS